jgi:hypothetical protein
MVLEVNPVHNYAADMQHRENAPRMTVSEVWHHDRGVGRQVNGQKISSLPDARDKSFCCRK